MGYQYITIFTECRQFLGDHYETLGSCWEAINSKLLKDGYDLRPYIFSPEGSMSEEDYLSMDRDETEEETKSTLEFYRLISKDEFFPIQEVIEVIAKVTPIIKDYPENAFDDDKKEAFLAELDELGQELESYAEEGLKVQLFDDYD